MKAYEGSFNYRRDDGKPIYDPSELQITESYELTIDGYKVDGVWYADTSNGIAKAYLDEGLVPNSIPYIFNEVQTRSLPDDIEAIKIHPDAYLLSRVLRGNVVIWGPE
jgi:hypothetical protein